MRWLTTFAFISVFAGSMSAFSASVPESTACSEAIGSCEYYRCRENYQNCGDNGYPIKFGYHYCKMFMDDVKPRMSPDGAKWLGKVATCLQESLDQLPLGATCEKTKAFAIGTHADCYVQTGYCELSEADQFEIMRTIYRAAIDPRVDFQFLKIMHGCSLRQSFAVEEPLIP